MPSPLQQRPSLSRSALLEAGSSSGTKIIFLPTWAKPSFALAIDFYLQCQCLCPFFCHPCCCMLRGLWLAMLGRSQATQLSLLPQPPAGAAQGGMGRAICLPMVTIVQSHAAIKESLFGHQAALEEILLALGACCDPSSRNALATMRAFLSQEKDFPCMPFGC